MISKNGKIIDNLVINMGNNTNEINIRSIWINNTTTIRFLNITDLSQDAKDIIGWVVVLLPSLLGIIVVALLVIYFFYCKKKKVIENKKAAKPKETMKKFYVRPTGGTTGPENLGIMIKEPPIISEFQKSVQFVEFDQTKDNTGNQTDIKNNINVEVIEISVENNYVSPGEEYHKKLNKLQTAIINNVDPIKSNDENSQLSSSRALLNKTGVENSYVQFEAIDKMNNYVRTKLGNGSGMESSNQNYPVNTNLIIEEDNKDDFFCNYRHTEQSDKSTLFQNEQKQINKLKGFEDEEENYAGAFHTVNNKKKDESEKLDHTGKLFKRKEGISFRPKNKSVFRRKTQINVTGRKSKFISFFIPNNSNDKNNDANNKDVVQAEEQIQNIDNVNNNEIEEVNSIENLNQEIKIDENNPFEIIDKNEEFIISPQNNNFDENNIIDPFIEDNLDDNIYTPNENEDLKGEDFHKSYVYTIYIMFI